MHRKVAILSLATVVALYMWYAGFWLAGKFLAYLLSR